MFLSVYIGHIQGIPFLYVVRVCVIECVCITQSCISYFLLPTLSLSLPSLTDTERDATPGPTYAEPSEIRPPPLPSPPSPYSQVFYTGPCSPYEQPTPSRTGTITSSFGPSSYASLSNSNSPHAEFAAQLKAVGNSLSDGGETMRLSEPSSRSGRISGRVKIYEEGVYHEPTEVLYCHLKHLRNLSGEGR